MNHNIGEQMECGSPKMNHNIGEQMECGSNLGSSQINEAVLSINDMSTTKSSRGR